MSRRVSLGAALFFCLLAAAVAAAVLVVRARTPDLVLEVTRQCPPDARRHCLPAFDPAGNRPPNRIEITFFVRESDDGAFVGIADSHEGVVRTLDEGVALAADQPVTYLWDGRTDSGTLAPPGRYRLRVDLPSEDREMIWPRRIFVQRLPSRAEPSDGARDGSS